MEKITGILHSEFIYKIVSVFLIFFAAVIVLKVFDKVITRWQKLAAKKNKDSALAGYSLETRFAIIKRIASATVYSFAFIFILLQFDAARSLGIGLFASAGLASIVLGLAAQNTLSNIIAGISISFSQPIRLHDAVVFKDEFGVVEEISLTHITILTWDNRRIVVPNSIMAAEVIQNWTMKETSLIGTVLFFVDYSCDVEKIRVWANQIVSLSPNSTSERMALVQVTDLSERSMQLRILVKGQDPGKTWDLRCEVREKMIEKFKEAGVPLPQIRVNLLEAKP